MGRPIWCLGHPRRGPRHRFGGDRRVTVQKRWSDLFNALPSMRLRKDAPARPRARRQRGTCCTCRAQAGRSSHGRGSEGSPAKTNANRRPHHDAGLRLHAPTSCIRVPSASSGPRQAVQAGWRRKGSPGHQRLFGGLAPGRKPAVHLSSGGWPVDTVRDHHDQPCTILKQAAREAGFQELRRAQHSDHQVLGRPRGRAWRRTGLQQLAVSLVIARHLVGHTRQLLTVPHLGVQVERDHVAPRLQVAVGRGREFMLVALRPAVDERGPAKGQLQNIGLRGVGRAGRSRSQRQPRWE